MTSTTTSHQTPIPATNAPAPSYASAAGATGKKPLTATPVVASSSAPLVAAGTSLPAPQHAKSNSVSPVNGQRIMPAVPQKPQAAPAVAHGTSNLNGDAHSHKPSVTISAVNNPSSNGGPVAPKNIPQFGFQSSPAVSHSTPQGGSAPISIPNPSGNPHIPDPQQSPSPIPQPSTTGGRPPTSTQQGSGVTFGSFQETPNQVRRPSTSQPNTHVRSESTQSMVNDGHSHGGPPQGNPAGRGGFQQAGRGRGGFNANFNNTNQSMGGYPPPQGSFRPNQGRGGMQGNYNRPPYGAGTSPNGRGSPVVQPALPHNPGMPPQQPYFYTGPPPPPMPMGGPMQANVHTPVLAPFQHSSFRQGRKKKDKYPNFSHRRSDSNNDGSREHYPKVKHKRIDQRFVQEHHESRQRGQFPQERGERLDMPPPNQPPMINCPFPPSHFPPPMEPLDLSPASGNFDYMLTNAKQYGNAYPYDPRAAMMYSQPMMYGAQPQSPNPGFQGPYGAPSQFAGAQPMSRNGSQMSERPGSSTGQNPTQAPAIAQGTPRTTHVQTGHTVIAQGSNMHTTFKPPRKSAAITIKNANGETVDLTTFKAPASPAPSSQPSKTPPVIASTPTPPPKPSTPKVSGTAHTRTDSAAAKTSAEVQNEFKEKIARSVADGSKTKEEEEAKALAEKAAEDAKLAEEQAKAEKLQAEQKAQEEAKAKEVAEAEAKAKADAAEAAKVSEKQDDKKDEANEEDEMERMIREMEEAEAKREAEEQAYAAKKKVETEAKKKAAEAQAKTDAADNDRKMREAEAEAERLEEEKERKRAAASGKVLSVQEALAGLNLSDKGDKADKATAPPTPSETTVNKPANLTINNKPGAVAGAKVSPGDKRGIKPPPLNLNTKNVEPPQPSAALQSLKTARLLNPHELLGMNYPSGFNSPNPALNAAVSKKGTSFKYDPTFLLQFKTVFTEQPSMEFHQQVKSLIGDNDGGSRSASARTPAGGSGRQNSRTGGASGFGAMGSFGTAPGGRTLPPNTTSKERFEASMGSMPRPQMGGGPMASFQRPGGAFPGGSMMSRTPSSSNMVPNSPRTGSRANRNVSKRDQYNAKSEAQAAKTMPLTAGVKIEALSVSSSGWKPTSIGQKGSGADKASLMDPPTVQRKVKAALNKMTPDNFDRISEQILGIAAQSKEESDGRTLRQVIQLTFEKATDEAHWASMYAKFCKRMLETMSPEIRDENIKDKNGQVVSGGALFRKYLLNRCQEEFERGWKAPLPEAPEGGDKAQEAALLSDEYYKAAAAKRRGLGLVQFIGELFKLGMLTERIMHECVRKLVDYQGMPDEAEVESLSKLLRTIGQNLDSTDKGKLMMDAYFSRIQSMIELPDLPSRLQFMLMDVVDLRKLRWVSKDANKGPKTLDEVRAEAEAAAAQKAAEAARSNQRGGGGRAPMGRGDARQFSSGYAQAAPNQIGMDDLRRLKGGANRTSSQGMTLGPTSMFTSRSNSGRRLGPGGSLSRGAEDSGASSRTGTPPTREPQSNNQYSLLANMEDNPASPPSTAASPALSKAMPDTSADK